MVLILLLLLVLVGALTMSAQGRFNRDYEMAIKVLLQQNIIAARLAAGM